MSEAISPVNKHSSAPIIPLRPIENENADKLDKPKNKDRYKSTIARAKEKISTHPDDYPVSKPILPFPKERKKAVCAAEIFNRVSERISEIVCRSEEPILGKVNSIGTKVEKAKSGIRKTEKEMIDKQTDVETWQSRKNLAYNLVNVATAAAGVGILLAGGAPVAGAMLLAGGIGGGLSSLISHFWGSSTLTTGLSVASGIAGLAGGVASAVANPSAVVSLVQSGVQVLGTATAGIMAVAESQNRAELSKIKAAHTGFEVENQTQTEKLYGAYSSYSGVASLSHTIKTIARAQQKHQRTLEEVLRKQKV